MCQRQTSHVDLLICETPNLESTAHPSYYAAGETEAGVRSAARLRLGSEDQNWGPKSFIP